MAFKKVPVTYVVVTLQVEGIHNWPEVEAFAEGVSFLKHPHRHIFHIKATKAVTHDDRDVEIILFKRDIQDHLREKFGTVGIYHSKGFPIDFGSMSCEMIAKHLCETFDLRSCEVMEDGENGAFVEIQKHFIPEAYNDMIKDNIVLCNEKIVKERDTFNDDHLIAGNGTKE